MRGITVNVGTVRGGTRPNVVPDLAEAEIDVRFRTLADGERSRAALEALRPSDPRVTLEVEASAFYPPLERGPHVEATYRLAREVAAALGLPPLEEVATAAPRRRPSRPRWGSRRSTASAPTATARTPSTSTCCLLRCPTAPRSPPPSSRA